VPQGGKIVKNIYWHEGLFLRENHFIAMERNFREQLLRVSQSANRFYWGVSECSLDQSKLTDYTISLERFRAVFKDGSLIDSDVNCFIRDEIIKEDRDRYREFVTIYAGLQKQRDAGLEVEEISKTDRRGSRYIKSEHKGDRLAGNDDEQIEYLDYQVILLPEYKIGETKDYEVIPLFEVRFMGDKLELNEKYEPPRILVSDSRYLMDVLANLDYKMYNLYRELSDQQIPAKFRRDKINPEYVLSLLILNAINDKLPELRAAKESKGSNITPSRLYDLIKQFAGSLSTFYQSSPAINVFGESSQLNIPTYNHTSIRHCFEKAVICLEHIINSLSQKQENKVILYWDRGYYLAKNIKRSFLAEHELCLRIISSHLQKADCKDIEEKGKVHSELKIRKIVDGSLLGAQIEFIENPPPGVYSGVENCYYFMITDKGDVCKDIEKELSIGFYYRKLKESDKVEIISL
jgi:type VI secretion system protein ImpJ